MADGGESHGGRRFNFKSRLADSNIKVIETDPEIFWILSANINNIAYTDTMPLNRFAALVLGRY
jgi:hypothetical protein